MNKVFLLRTTEETFNNIKELAEKEDRSINYMMNKVIEKGLNQLCIDTDLLNEIEAYSKKLGTTKEEYISSMWKAYRKTFKGNK